MMLFTAEQVRDMLMRLAMVLAGDDETERHLQQLAIALLDEYTNDRQWFAEQLLRREPR